MAGGKISYVPETTSGSGHLVEQMDRSGKVAGAFRRLTVLKQAKELESARPELPSGPFQVIVADPPWRY